MVAIGSYIFEGKIQTVEESLNGMKKQFTINTDSKKIIFVNIRLLVH
jgi:hypothetical protein